MFGLRINKDGHVIQSQLRRDDPINPTWMGRVELPQPTSFIRYLRRPYWLDREYEEPSSTHPLPQQPGCWV